MVESTQASTAELEGWQPADGAGRVVGCQLRWVESAHGWSLCSKTLKPGEVETAYSTWALPIRSTLPGVPARTRSLSSTMKECA